MFPFNSAVHRKATWLIISKKQILNTNTFCAIYLLLHCPEYMIIRARLQPHWKYRKINMLRNHFWKSKTKKFAHSHPSIPLTYLFSFFVCLIPKKQKTCFTDISLCIVLQYKICCSHPWIIIRDNRICCLNNHLDQEIILNFSPNSSALTFFSCQFMKKTFLWM